MGHYFLDTQYNLLTSTICLHFKRLFIQTKNLLVNNGWSPHSWVSIRQFAKQNLLLLTQVLGIYFISSIPSVNLNYLSLYIYLYFLYVSISGFLTLFLSVFLSLHLFLSLSCSTSLFKNVDLAQSLSVSTVCMVIQYHEDEPIFRIKYVPVSFSFLFTSALSIFVSFHSGNPQYHERVR